jgi:hypothetical protein
MALKPGSETPKSGQYGVYGPRGGNTGREVTSTRGNPMPPQQKSGMTYRLTDPTKHQK